jgi:formate dehydrogenase subunit gamma
MPNPAGILRWVAVLAALVLAGAAQAQYAPTSPQQLVEQQQQRSTVQPGNNAPVWKEVRSGRPQFSSLPGREPGVLIQSGGETWRLIRNGPITFYGGWLLIVIVVLIAAFYLVRGSIKVRDKPTGRLIERFSALDRVVHWSVAICFCVLAITGLIILFGKYVLLPVIGYTLFAWLTALSKNLHNFIAPLFIVSLLATIVVFIRDNLPNASDVTWFAKAGGLFTSAHVPSGRFNGGEKGWFWVGVVILGIAMCVTGLIMLFPNFEQTRATMQLANILHGIGAMLFIALGLGHIYMGTIGVEGAYETMRGGFVDESWAKEHHELWYNDIKSGKIASKTDQSGVPQMQRQS